MLQTAFPCTSCQLCPGPQVRRQQPRRREPPMPQQCRATAVTLWTTSAMPNGTEQGRQSPNRRRFSDVASSRVQQQTTSPPVPRAGPCLSAFGWEGSHSLPTILHACSVDQWLSREHQWAVACADGGAPGSTSAEQCFSRKRGFCMGPTSPCGLATRGVRSGAPPRNETGLLCLHNPVWWQGRWTNAAVCRLFPWRHNRVSGD